MTQRMTPDAREQFHESIAQAMLTVIDKRRKQNPEGSLDWLTQPNKKVPDGFWGDVREILNKDGITRPSGGEWTEDAHLSVQYVLKPSTKADIYGRVGKWLNIDVKKEEPTGKPRQKKRMTSGPQEPPKTEEESVAPNLHDALKQLMAEINSIKQQGYVPPVRPDRDETWDEPAFPPSGLVKTTRISADINLILWNLLEKERKRQGGNRARALQIILWRGLGRPSLFPEKTDE